MQFSNIKLEATAHILHGQCILDLPMSPIEAQLHFKFKQAKKRPEINNSLVCILHIDKVISGKAHINNTSIAGQMQRLSKYQRLKCQLQKMRQSSGCTIQQLQLIQMQNKKLTFDPETNSKESQKSQPDPNMPLDRCASKVESMTPKQKNLRFKWEERKSKQRKQERMEVIYRIRQLNQARRTLDTLQASYSQLFSQFKHEKCLQIVSLYNMRAVYIPQSESFEEYLKEQFFRLSQKGKQQLLVFMSTCLMVRDLFYSIFDACPLLYMEDLVVGSFQIFKAYQTHIKTKPPVSLSRSNQFVQRCLKIFMDPSFNQLHLEMTQDPMTSQMIPKKPFLLEWLTNFITLVFNLIINCEQKEEGHEDQRERDIQTSCTCKKSKKIIKRG